MSGATVGATANIEGVSFFVDVSVAVVSAERGADPLIRLAVAESENIEKLRPRKLAHIDLVRENAIKLAEMLTEAAKPVAGEKPSRAQRQRDAEAAEAKAKAEHAGRLIDLQHLAQGLDEQGIDDVTLAEVCFEAMLNRRPNLRKGKR